MKTRTFVGVLAALFLISLMVGVASAQPSASNVSAEEQAAFDRELSEFDPDLKAEIEATLMGLHESVRLDAIRLIKGLRSPDRETKVRFILKRFRTVSESAKPSSSDSYLCIVRELFE